MNKRINLILNGKRDLATVIKNLRALFDSGDKILLYTKSEKTEFFDTLKNELGIEDIEKDASYNKFNEINRSELKNNGTKKIIGIKMPNSLFHTISKAYNDAFEFIDETEVAEFVHCFTDDCKIVIPERYDPSLYEWYMDNFEEPFIMDSKTNPGNYAFRKYSPRFVFISASMLKSPVSFVQFESKEHFIINRTKIKDKFDGKLYRMYVSEFIIRLHNKGIIRHPSFYPDPVIETWIKRDDSLPFCNDIETLQKEYSSDEKYIRENLHGSLAIENSVDPIVGEMATVIEQKLRKTAKVEK